MSDELRDRIADETQIVTGYSHVAYMDSQGMCSEAGAAREARRGIARIKAEALREAADRLLNGTWPEGFFEGVAGSSRELMARADQIEKEAGL